MDAGGWRGKRFQIPKRSGDTETFFLCAFAPEFLTRGGFVYPNPAKPGNDGDGAGARSACARWQSCPLRGDHAAGTGRSFDFATNGCRNVGWDLRRFGAAPRCHRTLRRYVLRGVAKYARTGLAHGAWRGHVQSVAAGTVAWLGLDPRRCRLGCGRGTGIDAVAWKSPLRGEPPRSARVRLRIRGHDHRCPGSLFSARVARLSHGPGPCTARLIPCLR